MPTLLPRDSENKVIPAVRLKDAGAHSIAIGSSSVRNSTAFHAETQVVSLYATVPVHVKFGTSNVTATTSDHYFPAGTYYDFSIGGGKVSHYTHVAVIRSGNGLDGMLYISEKE